MFFFFVLSNWLVWVALRVLVFQPSASASSVAAMTLSNGLDITDTQEFFGDSQVELVDQEVCVQPCTACNIVAH